MRPGDRVALTCDDLDDDGAGVGQSVGEAGAHRVHVACALPGERVGGVVEHVSRQSGAAWARL